MFKQQLQKGFRDQLRVFTATVTGTSAAGRHRSTRSQIQKLSKAVLPAFWQLFVYGKPGEKHPATNCPTAKQGLIELLALQILGQRLGEHLSSAHQYQIIDLYFFPNVSKFAGNSSTALFTSFKELKNSAVY